MRAQLNGGELNGGGDHTLSIIGRMHLQARSLYKPAEFAFLNRLERLTNCHAQLCSGRGRGGIQRERHAAPAANTSG
jgi:hypothetical protein